MQPEIDFVEQAKSRMREITQMGIKPPKVMPTSDEMLDYLEAQCIMEPILLHNMVGGSNNPAWGGFRGRGLGLIGCQRTLREAIASMMNYPAASLCSRLNKHDGPCNGFPRTECLDHASHDSSKIIKDQ